MEEKRPLWGLPLFGSRFAIGMSVLYRHLSASPPRFLLRAIAAGSVVGAAACGGQIAARPYDGDDAAADASADKGPGSSASGGFSGSGSSASGGFSSSGSGVMGFIVGSLPTSSSGGFSGTGSSSGGFGGLGSSSSSGGDSGLEDASLITYPQPTEAGDRD
jgi:hypothetical protein